MCQCVNVEIGSYANQTELATPDHMRGKQIDCLAIRDTTCIDCCLSEEIQSLWAQGITTLGCCCGHNKLPGYIQVLESDAGRMRALGYEQRDCKTDEFLPKGADQ